MSERDICSKFITPALLNAGWDLHHQVREEVSFTDGRIQICGKLTSRGVRKRADYMLSLKANQPLALIEAKDNNHSLGSGMQQALEYAEILDIPFVYSSNGDAFLEHDRISTSGILECEISLDKFPDPMTLWNRYKRAKGISLEQEQLLGQEYYSDGRGRAPRYYQRIAINRVVEQIISGQNRCLLVMATGTGKTYTAFQIIWRLWKSRVKRRILFLADRNILIDQTMINDFKPYEVYLSLYQAITGPEEEQKIFKQFSPDFFDLIVIDECHRGSAREDSAWKEILDYFDAATHLGLTATPKKTKYASNITYFGDPIYTYSLKQGIEEDGIESSFPASFRTKETADLFMVLIMHLLKDGGRAGVVLPDGFLFGEGVKTRIKEKLLSEFNLHTIVRLPNGVFNPYTGIKTNLLFFEKGKATEAIWYYEHPYPPGVKSYNKTKPIRIEEFEREKQWWAQREESSLAWRVPVADIVKNNYNLDLKNPHVADSNQETPEVLFVRYQALQSEIQSLRSQLRDELKTCRRAA